MHDITQVFHESLWIGLMCKTVLHHNDIKLGLFVESYLIRKIILLYCVIGTAVLIQILRGINSESSQAQCLVLIQLCSIVATDVQHRVRHFVVHIVVSGNTELGKSFHVFSVCVCGSRTIQIGVIHQFRINRMAQL